jgi:hypothetical protein
MSRFYRYEMIYNGQNEDTTIKRVLVLDADFNLRQISRFSKNYQPLLWRTSQMAYAGDIVIETIYNRLSNSLHLSFFKVEPAKALTRPRTTLTYTAMDESEISRVEDWLRSDDARINAYRGFLFLDQELELNRNIRPEQTNGVLPTTDEWVYGLGVMEEKQAAFALDLLGGCPVAFMEEIAECAMYTPRNLLNPVETNPMPDILCFDKYISTTIPPQVIDVNHQVRWVTYDDFGRPTVHDESDNGLAIDESYVHAIKLYIRPFAVKGDESYGLVVEMYSREVVRTKYPASPVSEPLFLATTLA